MSGPVRSESGRPPISLIVLVAVDQMRADYLARYAGQWTGGFARIYRGGTVFEHGEQDHAATETAPGHSTMLSGRYPAHTGIALNSRGVQDRASPALSATPDTIGASPRRFRGTTLYDWMLAGDSGTRMLSVSRKDRAAIFPIGRARGPVYWLYGGAFTTSRYYADSLPSWVQAFNRGLDLTRWTGATWNLLLPDSAYAEPDSMPFENGGADYTFPHRLTAAPGAVARQPNAFPWMDSLTLAFALDGVRALGLGDRGRPDLLSISLSTTDAVGHAFGPDSREIHDQLLHVDRWLGQFLDSLSRLAPAAGTVVVLTGDHGVTSLPEYTVTVQHRPGGRVSLAGVARGASAALRDRLHADFGIEADGGLVMADVGALRARGVDVDSLARVLTSEAGGLPGVARVFTPQTLARAPDSDRDATLWRRLLPSDYGWLVSAMTSPGYVWSGGGLDAEHGSANPEDIAVPIAFYGAGIRAQRIERRASTVDIAPTLAALIGVTPTEALDGHVLIEVVSRQASP
ncbi:MAG TPA: alkaline phosphatase family protein [Gemmatimonadales bacterium]|nr:alkaline phosphatase family protein [Gemmatimonadales bacterium]